MFFLYLLFLDKLKRSITQQIYTYNTVYKLSISRGKKKNKTQIKK